MLRAPGDALQRRRQVTPAHERQRRPGRGLVCDHGPLDPLRRGQPERDDRRRERHLHRVLVRERGAQPVEREDAGHDEVVAEPGELGDRRALRGRGRCRAPRGRLRERPGRPIVGIGRVRAAREPRRGQRVGGGIGPRATGDRRRHAERARGDLQPVTGLDVVGGEAERLAEEDRRGLVLVATGGEHAEQPVGDRAARIEANDVAEVSLRVEVAPQRDPGARAEHEARNALGLGVEGIGAQRDHPRIVPRVEQLRGSRDDSSIHKAQDQQAASQPGRASKPPRSRECPHRSGGAPGPGPGGRLPGASAWHRPVRLGILVGCAGRPGWHRSSWAR